MTPLILTIFRNRLLCITQIQIRSNLRYFGSFFFLAAPPPFRLGGDAQKKRGGPRSGPAPDPAFIFVAPPPFRLGGDAKNKAEAARRAASPRPPVGRPRLIRAELARALRARADPGGGPCGPPLFFWESPPRL